VKKKAFLQPDSIKNKCHLIKKVSKIVMRRHLPLKEQMRRKPENSQERAKKRKQARNPGLPEGDFS
jgi:hypothetical protein|tara:strand:+ start:31936 stop:32133 length:198 start_codon:yes stop_codon:yes gene_type:complete